jgi:hypothetical protein
LPDSPEPSVQDARLFALKIAIAGGLLAGLLLSPKLWLSSRFYPQTPVLPFLRPIPFPIDYAVYALLLLLLVTIAVVPRPAKPIAAFLCLAAVLALLDQSRWQPWFYQYLFMLLALGLSSRSPAAAMNTCRLIVVCTYFWSGLQKVNPGFADDVFPWMAEPLTRFLPAGARWLIALLGLVVPFVETGIGIALLTRKFRTAAMYLAIGMHVFILIGIGPFGHSANTVVWPWNLAMVAFLLILFRGSGDVSWRELVWGRGAVSQRVVLVLFGVLPLLSFFNLWDHYLSSALYSGNRNNGVLYLSDDVLAELPDSIQEVATNEGPDVNKLEIADWSFRELNVPAYPEMRIYKNVARSLCGFAESASDVRLAVEAKGALFRGKRTFSFDCTSLSPFHAAPP